MDDDAASLVSRAGQGDQAAWDGLVDRYSGLLWSIARSYRLRDADASDVLQTAWMRLLEHLDRIEDPERVGAWLATVVRHEIHRLYRRSRRTVSTDDDAVLDAAVGPSSGPDAAVVRGERDRLLWEAFAELTDRCQRLLRMLITGFGATEALSYKDAAVALGIPMGSLGPTRMRCLSDLRLAVERRGISGEPDDSA
ncbi:MAG: sigma-70 family RNA polymerase sigma factor [Kineosporiaceae bacterium]